MDGMAVNSGPIIFQHSFPPTSLPRMLGSCGAHVVRGHVAKRSPSSNCPPHTIPPHPTKKRPKTSVNVHRREDRYTRVRCAKVPKNFPNHTTRCMGRAPQRSGGSAESLLPVAPPGKPGGAEVASGEASPETGAPRGAAASQLPAAAGGKPWKVPPIVPQTGVPQFPRLPSARQHL